MRELRGLSAASEISTYQDEQLVHRTAGRNERGGAVRVYADVLPVFAVDVYSARWLVMVWETECAVLTREDVRDDTGLGAGNMVRTMQQTYESTLTSHMQCRWARPS